MRRNSNGYPMRVPVAGLLVNLAAFGCAGPQHVAAPSVQTRTLAELYEVRDADLSCEQAQRLAYRTVERMGYPVTRTEPAADEKPGAILAEQRRGEHVASVRVTVTCAVDGVVVDAASLSSLDVASDDPHPLVTYHSVNDAQRLSENRPPPTTYFRRAFYSLFHGLAANAKRSGPEGTLSVKVRPLPPIEEELRLGRSLPEVTVVAVEIANRTQKTYVFDTERVRLLTPDGGRVAPLAAHEVSSVESPMTSQAVAAQVVARGYLYYPVQEYVGVDGYLIEAGSEARHEFRSEFPATVAASQ